MNEGQTTYLHIGIDGSSAQAGARVVQRSLEDISSSATNTNNTMLKMKEILFGIAGAAVGVYGVSTAIQAIGNYAKESLNYLGSIETATLGIAASYLVSGKYINETTGKALEGTNALRVAQAESAQAIERLKFANLKTMATLDELIVAYQTTLPVAMSKGFNRKQVEDFTLAMVQAAGAIGLPFNQMAEETRSMLMGTINPRNTRIATVLGLTNEDVAQYKGNAEGLFNFLMGRLEGFRVAGEASMTTWKGLWSNFKDISQQISGEMFKPVFDAVKDQLSSFLKSAIVIDPERKTYQLSNDIKLVIAGVKTLADMFVHASKVLAAYVIIFKGGEMIERIKLWTAAKFEMLVADEKLTKMEAEGTAVRLGSVKATEMQVAAAIESARAKVASAEATLQEVRSNQAQLQSNIAIIESEQVKNAAKIENANLSLRMATVEKEAAAFKVSAIQTSVTLIYQEIEANTAHYVSQIRNLEAMGLYDVALQQQNVMTAENAVLHSRLAVVKGEGAVAEARLAEAVKIHTVAQEQLNTAISKQAALGTERAAMQKILIENEKKMAGAITDAANANRDLDEKAKKGQTALAGIGTAMSKLANFAFNWFMYYQIADFFVTMLPESAQKGIKMFKLQVQVGLDEVVSMFKYAFAKIEDYVTGGFAGAMKKFNAQREKTAQEFADKMRDIQDPDWRKREADSAEQAKYVANKKEEQLKNQVKSELEHTKNLMEIQRQYTENKLNLVKEVLSQELAAAKVGYDNGVISLKDYLAKKKELEVTEANAAVIRARENVRAANLAYQGAADISTKTPEEEIKKLREMEKLKKGLIAAEGELATAKLKVTGVERAADAYSASEFKKRTAERLAANNELLKGSVELYKAEMQSVGISSDMITYESKKLEILIQENDLQNKVTLAVGEKKTELQEQLENQKKINALVLEELENQKKITDLKKQISVAEEVARVSKILGREVDQKELTDLKAKLAYTEKMKYYDDQINDLRLRGLNAEADSLTTMKQQVDYAYQRRDINEDTLRTSNELLGIENSIVPAIQRQTDAIEKQTEARRVSLAQATTLQDALNAPISLGQVSQSFVVSQTNVGGNTATASDNYAQQLLDEANAREQERQALIKEFIAYDQLQLLRNLTLRGMTDEAELYRLVFKHQEELNKAMEKGFDITGLKLIQQAEYNQLIDNLNIKRAAKEFEEATKTIMSSLEKMIADGKTLIDSLRGAAKSIRETLLDFNRTNTALTPLQQYQNTKAEFQATYTEAMATGNAELYAKLPELFSAFVESSKGMFASGAGYQTDVSWAVALLDTAQAQADLQADAMQQTVNSAEMQLQTLKDILAALTTNSTAALPKLYTELSSTSGTLYNSLGTLKGSTETGLAIATNTIDLGNAKTDATNAKLGVVDSSINYGLLSGSSMLGIANNNIVSVKGSTDNLNSVTNSGLANNYAINTSTRDHIYGYLSGNWGGILVNARDYTKNVNDNVYSGLNTVNASTRGVTDYLGYVNTSINYVNNTTAGVTDYLGYVNTSINYVNNTTAGVKDYAAYLPNINSYSSYLPSVSTYTYQTRDNASYLNSYLPGVYTYGSQTAVNTSHLLKSSSAIQENVTRTTYSYDSLGNRYPVTTVTGMQTTTYYSYYAKGGIANDPTGRSIFGEAGPEAAVPLPDGRTIPVTLSGGGETVAELKETNKQLAASVRVLQAGFAKLIEINEQQEKRLAGVENTSKLRMAA